MAEGKKKRLRNYDAAFKTLVQEEHELAIFLVNDMFQKDYPPSTDIVLLGTETQGVGEGRRTADSCFQVVGYEHSVYIIECQSKPDAKMVLRLGEYGLRHALAGGKELDDRVEFEIPSLGVVYLRGATEGLENKPISIVAENGAKRMDISPASLMARELSLDDIDSRDLFILIPFQAFRMETALKTLGNVEDKVIRDSSTEVAEYLLGLTEDGVLPQKSADSLLEMYQAVAEHIVIKQPEEIKERVRNIMASSAGYVFEGSSVTRQARAQGREEAQQEIACTMFLKGLMPQRVSELMDESKEVINKYYQHFKNHKDEIRQQYEAKRSKHR